MSNVGAHLLFVHRRTLRKGRVIASAVNFLGLSLFLSLAAYSVFFQEKSSVAWFGKAVFAILAITLPIVIWWLVRLFNGKGEWNIQISETELTWLVPDNIGEKNLNLPISKISKIICESSKSIDAGNYYYIEMVDGKKYPINTSASGINLNKFFNVLGSLGVKHETQ
jgi:hypothetical protein